MTTEPNAGADFAEALRLALEAENQRKPHDDDLDAKPVSTESLMRPVYQPRRVKAKKPWRYSDRQERGEYA